MIDEIEDMLRECGVKLEEAAQKVYQLRGGERIWNEINKSMFHIRDAIHNISLIEEV